jgi:hypothetical protein
VVRAPSTANEDWVQDALLDVARFISHHLGRVDSYRSLWGGIDKNVQAADKVAVEAALFALVADRAVTSEGHPYLATTLGEIVERLTPLIRSPENLRALARAPHSATTLGIGHALLTRLGSESRLFDELVRDSFDSGLAHASERMPHRLLEARWVAGLLDLHWDRDLQSILVGSILGGCPSPIHMSEADAYAFTHVIMFVTDFGAQPEMIEPTDGVLNLLNECTEWHLLTGNLDILAELLLCYEMLDWPRTASAEIGWKYLREIWRTLGFLPSPSFVPAEFSALENRVEASAYSLLHTYHTMLVAGMLCAVRSSRASARPAEATEQDVSGVGESLDLLPSPIRDHQRCRDLRQYCGGFTTRGVRAAVVEAGLIMAARRNDLESTNEVLTSITWPCRLAGVAYDHLRRQLSALDARSSDHASAE